MHSELIALCQCFFGSGAWAAKPPLPMPNSKHATFKISHKPGVGCLHIIIPSCICCGTCVYTFSGLDKGKEPENHLLELFTSHPLLLAFASSWLRFSCTKSNNQHGTNTINASIVVSTMLFSRKSSATAASLRRNWGLPAAKLCLLRHLFEQGPPPPRFATSGLSFSHSLSPSMVTPTPRTTTTLTHTHRHVRINSLLAARRHKHLSPAAVSNPTPFLPVSNLPPRPLPKHSSSTTHPPRAQIGSIILASNMKPTRAFLLSSAGSACSRSRRQPRSSRHPLGLLILHLPLPTPPYAHTQETALLTWEPYRHSKPVSCAPMSTKHAPAAALFSIIPFASLGAFLFSSRSRRHA